MDRHACCFTLGEGGSGMQGGWVDPRSGLEAVDKRMVSSTTYLPSSDVKQNTQKTMYSTILLLLGCVLCSDNAFTEPLPTTGEGCIYRDTDRWEGCIMDAVEMGSVAMILHIHIPSFIKTFFGMQKIRIHRQHGNHISKSKSRYN
jgi:hypothetical protein